LPPACLRMSRTYCAPARRADASQRRCLLEARERVLVVPLLHEAHGIDATADAVRDCTRRLVGLPYRRRGFRIRLANRTGLPRQQGAANGFTGSGRKGKTPWPTRRPRRRRSRVLKSRMRETSGPWRHWMGDCPGYAISESGIFLPRNIERCGRPFRALCANNRAISSGAPHLGASAYLSDGARRPGPNPLRVTPRRDRGSRRL
jgi:hypothetical protein